MSNLKKDPRYMELYRQARETITGSHDRREAYFLELIAFAGTHKYEEIPEEHRARLKTARVSVPWRANKHVQLRLKQSAQKFAKTALKKEYAQEYAEYAQEKGRG